MRLIQVEQSVVFKISYRLLAGEVCADRVHARKTNLFAWQTWAKVV